MTVEQRLGSRNSATSHGDLQVAGREREKQIENSVSRLKPQTPHPVTHLGQQSCTSSSFPNSSTYWGPSIKTRASGDLSHSNHHTHAHKHRDADTHTYTQRHRHTDAHKHRDTDTHTYTHTYTYTHTHRRRETG